VLRVVDAAAGPARLRCRPGPAVRTHLRARPEAPAGAAAVVRPVPAGAPAPLQGAAGRGRRPVEAPALLPVYAAVAGGLRPRVPGRAVRLARHRPARGAADGVRLRHGGRTVPPRPRRSP